MHAGGAIGRRGPGRGHRGHRHRRHRRRPPGGDRRGVRRRAARPPPGGDRRRRRLHARGAPPRQLCPHLHPGRLRAPAARGGADRRGRAHRQRQPGARRPLRGGHRGGDRDRHRRPGHQHAPRRHRGHPRDARAAGRHPARRPVPEPERQPRRCRRAEQLVQLEPAGDPHRERREREPARPGRLADAGADQRPAARAGARPPHRGAFRRRQHHPRHRRGPAGGAEGGRVGDLRLGRGRRRRQLRHPQRLPGLRDERRPRLLRQRGRHDRRGHLGRPHRGLQRRPLHGAGQPPGAADSGPPVDPRTHARLPFRRSRRLVEHRQPRHVRDRCAGPLSHCRRLHRPRLRPPLRGLRRPGVELDVPVPLCAVRQPDRRAAPDPDLRRDQRPAERPDQLPRRGALGRRGHPAVVHDAVLPAVPAGQHDHHGGGGEPPRPPDITAGAMPATRGPIPRAPATATIPGTSTAARSETRAPGAGCAASRAPSGSPPPSTATFCSAGETATGTSASPTRGRGAT